MDWNSKIPPFYENQKVIYITGINLPKDSVWTVKDVKLRCCNWIIDIGLVWNKPHNKLRTCSVCRRSFEVDNDAKYFAAKSFVPLNESEFQAVEYSKVIEEEKVGVN